jgi:hypothetical protein
MYHTPVAQSRPPHALAHAYAHAPGCAHAFNHAPHFHNLPISSNGRCQSANAIKFVPLCSKCWTRFPTTSLLTPPVHDNHSVVPSSADSDVGGGSPVDAYTRCLLPFRGVVVDWRTCLPWTVHWASSPFEVPLARLPGGCFAYGWDTFFAVRSCCHSCWDCWGFESYRLLVGWEENSHRS